MNDVILSSLNTANRRMTVGDDVISPAQAGSVEAPDMGLMNVSRAPFQKRRILCVDDEIVGTTIRADVLRHRGYSVDLYHSSLAVLRCDFSTFELAILDFEMPELNGRELLLRLRALGASFPMVLLTGCLETLSHEDRALFARCIDKGMPVHRLLDVVAELLDLNNVSSYSSRESYEAMP